MRVVWFIIAAIWLVIPVFGVWNIFFNGFQVSGMWEYVVLFGMLLIGLIIIILGFVQKSGVYVTGTMIKKTDVAIKDPQFGALPKDYDSSSSLGALPKEDNSSNPYVLDWNPFFNIEKKSWIIGTSVFPLIENISEEHLKIINELNTIPEKVESGEIEMTQTEADEVDTKIRENVYKFGLGTDLKTIRSIIDNEKERQLFPEVFFFITKIKTLENAKQDPIYDSRVIASQERVRSGGLMESDLQNNFTRFSWQQAEDLVGKLFEKKGYSVTIGVPTSDGGTKRQGDFGIDVEAKNEKEYLGIQVKHWIMDVGFEDVAKTLGVAQKFNKVIIVSTKSGFTSQASEHAQNNPYLIELWDSNKFKNELRQHVISSTNIQKSKGVLPKDVKNESG
jgi:HJR/Mrr/RecB family endonuclease